MEKESIVFSSKELAFNLVQKTFYENSRLRGFHFHEAIELIRVDSGELNCFIENEKFLLKEGDLVLVNRYVVHKLSYSNCQSKVTYIQIELSNYLEESSKTPYIPLISSHTLKYKRFPSNDQIGFILDDIINEQNGRQSHYKKFIKADILRICAIMSRNSMFPDYELINKTEFKKILPVLEYIENNLDEKIYLDDICKLVNIDKFYFCKFFKKTTGTTFVNYVNNVRLKRAEKLLINTNKKIIEIAYDCGFSTIQYFNKAFSSNYNCTPSEFRDLNVPTL